MIYPKQDLIFGHYTILEALQAGVSISKIYLQQNKYSPIHQEILSLASKCNVPCCKVPLVKINKLTRKKHNGALAWCSPIDFARLEDVVQSSFEKGKAPLLLLLDSITDVGNLGAIARTALSAGVDGLVLPIRRTALITGETLKISAGALVRLPVCRTKDLVETISYLKASGLQVIACTEKSSVLFYEGDMLLPTALLLGSEDKGISPACLQLADKLLAIPMYKPTSSLNVSVAAALFLYEVVRQRLK